MRNTRRIGHVPALLLICAAGLSAAVADGVAGEIDGARAALEKYVEVQRTISLEKRDLELSKEILAERIGLMEREIASLRAKIDVSKQSIAEGDATRNELIAENDGLQEASASLGDVLRSLEDGVRGLLARLPDPIRERVRPLSQRLPEEGSASKLSMAERFQNVVGILNETDKFNRAIAVTSEVRALPDGGSAEVTAIYLGIGQAYYTGANGSVAGVGSASEQAWAWKPADAAAARIAEVVAIMKNERIASFVQLPIEIQ